MENKTYTNMEDAEQRVIVLSSVHYKKMENLILSSGRFEKIKQKNGNIFLWGNLDRPWNEQAMDILQMIRTIPRNNILVYQLSPLVGGKIDLFGPDHTRAEKLNMPYFKMKHKDLSWKELSAFLEKQNG